MSDQDGNSPSEICDSEKIDLACDRFEAAWRDGERPRIETFVEAEGPEIGQTILRELLQVELELCQEAEESPVEDDYLQRFPDDAELIAEVFRKVVKRRHLGDYELLEELGRGGMGVIFRARQIHLNQIVAVKVLPDRFLDEPKAVSRFKREMQSIGGLDHPNIVRAHNAGEQDGTHFLAMEYVDGINLHQLVSRRGPLPIGTACELIRQAAKGLEHAHQNGLVHRDIKPANLMVSRFGVVKMLDLGLARMRVDREFLPKLTQTGIIIGTVGYMAPEQTQDSRNVDIRADIYSLGCTLFFLLTGSPPYGSESEELNIRTLRAHATEAIPSVRAKRSDCPAELDAIVARLLAKNADDRFTTPQEVVDAMKPLADHDSLEEPLPDAGASAPAGSTVSQKGRVSSGIDTEEGSDAFRDAATEAFAASSQRSTTRPLWLKLSIVVAVLAGAATLGIAIWQAQ